MKKKFSILIGIILIFILSFVSVNVTYAKLPPIPGVTAYNVWTKMKVCVCMSMPQSCWCQF